MTPRVSIRDVTGEQAWEQGCAGVGSKAVQVLRVYAVSLSVGRETHGYHLSTSERTRTLRARFMMRLTMLLFGGCFVACYGEFVD